MYVDLQGLIDRGWKGKLVQLTDRTNTPASTVDATVVARHIGDAASLIDSYLVKNYTLPLTAVPASLEKVAADLAIYFIAGDTVEKDSAIDRGYRDALRWLEQVARGQVALEAEGIVPPASGDGRVQLRGPDRIFSRDSLRGF